MANLPSQHPTLSLHLTDLALTPLITSSSSQAHLESLTSLATSALTSQVAVQRSNLGRPQRIMVEYPDSGPVVLQSYLDPRESPEAVIDAGAGGGAGRGTGEGEDGGAVGPLLSGEDAAGSSATGNEAGDAAAPALVGVVVAGSSGEVREARRAAARLERIGREFQKEWAAQDRAKEKAGMDGS